MCECVTSLGLRWPVYTETVFGIFSHQHWPLAGWLKKNAHRQYESPTPLSINWGYLLIPLGTICCRDVRGVSGRPSTGSGRRQTYPRADVRSLQKFRSEIFEYVRKRFLYAASIKKTIRKYFYSDHAGTIRETGVSRHHMGSQLRHPWKPSNITASYGSVGA